MKTTYFKTKEEIAEAIELGYLESPIKLGSNYGYGTMNNAPAVFWNDGGCLSHQNNNRNLLLLNDEYLNRLKESVSWSDIREEYIVPDMLPCPSCGKSNLKLMSSLAVAELFADGKELVVHKEYDDHEVNYIICDGSNGGCGLSSGWAENKIASIKKWNTRAC